MSILCYVIGDDVAAKGQPHLNGTNKLIRANETSCRSHAILHVCFAPSPCCCGILMQIVGSTVAPRLLGVPLWHYKFHTGLRRDTQSRTVFSDYRGLGVIVSWIFLKLLKLLQQEACAAVLAGKLFFIELA